MYVFIDRSFENESDTGWLLVIFLNANTKFWIHIISLSLISFILEVD